MKETCCASAYSPVDWKSHRCGKTAKFNEGGKWYCGTHAPSKVKERQDKRNAEFDASRKAREAHRRDYVERLWYRLKEMHDAEAIQELMGVVR